jgi:hypothetical protein
MAQAVKCIVLAALTLIPLSACVTPTKPQDVSRAPYQAVRWSGWTDDSTHEAWSAFLNSCKARGNRPEWLAACASAKQPERTREVLDSNLQLYNRFRQK